MFSQMNRFCFPNRRKIGARTALYPVKNALLIVLNMFWSVYFQIYFIFNISSKDSKKLKILRFHNIYFRGYNFTHTPYNWPLAFLSFKNRRGGGTYSDIPWKKNVLYHSQNSIKKTYFFPEILGKNFFLILKIFLVDFCKGGGQLFWKFGYMVISGKQKYESIFLRIT